MVTSRVHFARLLARMLILGPLMATPLVRAGELQLLTNENPPVSFSKDGQITGLGTEIVVEIQKRIGSRAPIRILPWARVYAMTFKQSNIAVFPTMRTAEREGHFKWVGPMTTVTEIFYARRESTLQIHSLEDAKTLGPILVSRESAAHQFLRSAGFSNLVDVNTPEMMVRELVSGRSAPVMAWSNIALDSLLTKIGATMQDVRPLYTFMHAQYYIAFSRDTPDSVVQQWQHALDDMKRDGSFVKLYETWLPGEVPPSIKPEPNIEPVLR